MNNPILQKLFGLFPALLLLSQAQGGFVGMLWTRPAKTKAAFKHLAITKTVSCVGRVGLSHDNRQAVKDARANGELPSVNQGLPWGQWLLAPWFIEHKGGIYVRLYPVEGRAPKVIFRLNGSIVSKASIADMLLSSEFSEVNESIGCMSLKAENLRAVRFRGKVATVS